MGLYVFEVVLGVIMYEGELVIFEEDRLEILLFLEYCFFMGKFFLEVIKIRNLGMLIDLKVCEIYVGVWVVKSIGEFISKSKIMLWRYMIDFEYNEMFLFYVFEYEFNVVIVLFIVMSIIVCILVLKKYCVGRVLFG